MRLVLSLALLAGLTLLVAPDAGAGERFLWRHTMDSTVSGRYVSVAPDGTVYTSDNQTLYALSPDGELLWSLPGAGGGRPIAVAQDGTLYTGSSGVVAVSPEGGLLWEFEPTGLRDLVAGPCIGPDGGIYAVHNTLGDGIGAFELDASGELQWSNPGDPAIASFPGGNSKVLFGPAVEDRLYFGAPTQGGAGPGVYAFTLDGDQVWTTFGQGCSALPEMDRDGHLIIVAGGSCGMRLHDADGGTIWHAEPPQNLISPARPAVGPDGVIYTTDFTGDVWAVNPDGSTRWYAHDVAFGLDNLGVSPDGGLLVGGRKGSDAAVVGISTADGALLWVESLPAEGGLSQLVESAHAVFSPDGNTVYVNTRFVSDPGYSYLYAIQASALATGVGWGSAGLAVRLGAPHPNPAREGAAIAFDLPMATDASLSIYDVSGRRVATLLDGAPRGAGRHALRWSGLDAFGRRPAAGVYLLRLETAGGFAATRRLVLVR